MIFRRFPIDEKPRPARSCRGSDGPGAVAFFPNDKEQPEVASARGEQSLRRSNHSRDDALRVKAGFRAEPWESNRAELPFMQLAEVASPFSRPRMKSCAKAVRAAM